MPFHDYRETDKRYCFSFGIDKFGILGNFPDAASSLEVLDKGEAKMIFRQYDEEGLMHSIWSCVTPYVIGMCNCDRDCGAYKGYIEMRGAPSFFRAEYVCQIDWDLCTGCKSCMANASSGHSFTHLHLSKSILILPGVSGVACVGLYVQTVPLH
jgi:hypothetical protein